MVVFAAIGAALVFWVYSLYANQKSLESKIQSRGNSINSLEKELSEQAVKTNKLRFELAELTELNSILNEPIPERYKKSASLIADIKSAHFDIIAKRLNRKKRPAKKEAMRIKELRQEYREALEAKQISEYKRETIISLFPELEIYFDDLEYLNHASRFKNLEDLSDHTDRTKHYLSANEYNELTPSQRNALALKRYIESSKKTNWQIGRDYELSVGHEYTTDGWNVDYTGINEGLSDLGRDLVCSKENEIHVVQCKYWAKHKSIREKHIAQLFGTAKLLELEQADLFAVVKPVFVTNIQLSDTARRFAKALNVKIIENRPLKPFPRIKCNVGLNPNGEADKIYHLPMDQHYDRTQLKKETDFFAHTIAEAEAKGFRRSFRWRGGISA